MRERICVMLVFLKKKERKRCLLLLLLFLCCLNTDYMNHSSSSCRSNTSYNLNMRTCRGHRDLKWSSFDIKVRETRGYKRIHLLHHDLRGGHEWSCRQKKKRKRWRRRWTFTRTFAYYLPSLSLRTPTTINHFRMDELAPRVSAMRVRNPGQPIAAD